MDPFKAKLHLARGCRTQCGCWWKGRNSFRAILQSYHASLGLGVFHQSAWRLESQWYSPEWIQSLNIGQHTHSPLKGIYEIYGIYGFPGFPGFSRISGIFQIFWIFVVSQRSGRHLESFLEPVRFILTKYEPISSHMDPIPFDSSRFCWFSMQKLLQPDLGPI